MFHGVVEQQYVFHVMDHALCLSESKQESCEKHVNRGGTPKTTAGTPQTTAGTPHTTQGTPKTSGGRMLSVAPLYTLFLIAAAWFL